MNKIIEQSQQLQTVRICYGNDFSLSLTVCVWNADTSAWDKVDLSAAQDVEMFLVAQNGKRIKTTTTVDENSNVIANIPSTYLSKTLYAIEITFKLDNRNRRTYSPGLIQIVNDTDEAGFSTQDYITNDAYHFDIKVTNDVAWLNIGQLPSEYVTEDELADVLTSYVTQDALSNNSYVTQTSLSSMGYITLEDIPEVDLSSYVTYNYLSNQSYVTSTELTNASYVTSTELTNASYVTSTELTNASYVTSSSLNSTLVDYVNGANYDSTNHLIQLTHDSAIVATIDAAPFIIDGMVDTVTISNGYLVISFNTDAGKQDISIPISQIFDANDYYTKMQVDDILQSYVTATALANASYVTSAQLNNAGYVTSAQLNNAGYVTAMDIDRAGYLQGETDPVFSASAASGITSSDISSWNSKQDELVSGTNIKTINNESILGSGNITIQGGGGGTVPDNVVTSYDGTYIYCLSQSDYDTLDQGGNLDSYTFYYITDATSNYVSQAELANYATQQYVDTAVSGITVPQNTSELNNDSNFIYGDGNIINITRITQNDYDILVNLNEIDPNTLYIIL